MKRIVLLAVGLGISTSALAWAIAEKPHYERQVSADYVHGQNNDEDNTQQDHRSDQDRNTGLYHSSLLFGWQVQSERDEKEQ
jgi:hypothetical protein